MTSQEKEVQLNLEVALTLDEAFLNESQRLLEVWKEIEIQDISV